MLIYLFPFPFIEVTLWLLLLDLGDVGPPLPVSAALGPPEDVVLEDLLVLPLGADRIKGPDFFNSVFLQIVAQLFVSVLNLRAYWEILVDQICFLCHFRISKWGGVFIC